MAQPWIPRILVIDDDQSLLENLNYVLQNIPLMSQYRGEVKTASLVDEACDLIVDFRPHIVFIDIVLNKEQHYNRWDAGLHILEQIRLLRVPFQDISVVVLTGRRELEAQCLQLGASIFLGKAVKLEQLRQVANDVLTAQQQKQERYKVFITASVGTMEAERNVVKDTIVELGPEVFPEFSEDANIRQLLLPQIRLRAVEECSCLVLLLKDDLNSMIRGELELAQRLKKNIIILIEAAPTPDSKIKDMFKYLAGTCQTIFFEQRNYNMLANLAQRAVYNQRSGAVTIIRPSELSSRHREGLVQLLCGRNDWQSGPAGRIGVLQSAGFNPQYIHGLKLDGNSISAARAVIEDLETHTMFGAASGAPSLQLLVEYLATDPPDIEERNLLEKITLIYLSGKPFDM